MDSLSFALDEEGGLVLIKFTIAEERLHSELVAKQRLVLALEDQRHGIPHSFSVHILLLLKPTAFDERLLGSQHPKHRGGFGID